MANLKLGDKIQFFQPPCQINEIVDVAPVRFDTIEETWVVCPQAKATHMLMVMNVSDNIDLQEIKYMMIEIGKCGNIYLLADAIVD